MEVYTRRLTATDGLQFQALNELFGEVFDDAENYLRHKPSETYLQHFLADDNKIVLVAEAGGTVVGGMAAYCLDKFEQERREIFIYDLAVSSRMQRQGIGRKLVEELKRIAKSMGAYVIFVQADEGDEAVKFYEALNPSGNLRTRNFDFKV